MSDFDGSSTELGKRKQRPGAAFGDLGDRLARAFGTMDRTRAGAATPARSDELSDIFDREAGPAAEPVAPRFALAWRGYDRAAVDEYVADLERYVADIDRELSTLQARSPSGSSVVNEIQRIGDQTAAIIRVAHEQAEAVTRRAQVEAEQCRDRAQADANAITEGAKQQLALLDGETDAVWRERERLVADLRNLAQGMSSLAEDAASRFPAEAEPAEAEAAAPGAAEPEPAAPWAAEPEPAGPGAAEPEPAAQAPPASPDAGGQQIEAFGGAGPHVV